jgi:hypothetical protein
MMRGRTCMQSLMNRRLFACFGHIFERILIHTRVSASGFFEELIHYGQVKSERAIFGDEENMLLMEIEAQEKLLRNQKAYGITQFEAEILTNNLNWYKIQLENLRKGGM